jgi:predicted transcriptional regulator
MPDRLKEQVQQLARAEDRSMNSFIVRTLKTVVEEKTASEPTV